MSWHSRELIINLSQQYIKDWFFNNSYSFCKVDFFSKTDFAVMYGHENPTYTLCVKIRTSFFKPLKIALYLGNKNYRRIIPSLLCRLLLLPCPIVVYICVLFLVWINIIVKQLEFLLEISP